MRELDIIRTHHVALKAAHATLLAQRATDAADLQAVRDYAAELDREANPAPAALPVTTTAFDAPAVTVTVQHTPPPVEPPAKQVGA